MDKAMNKNDEMMQMRREKEEFEHDISRLNDMIKISKKIVFFGGAGVSTESGIPDTSPSLAQTPSGPSQADSLYRRMVSVSSWSGI